MKILWLAPFPFLDDNNAHPAPWIISLATALVKNDVELTILNYNSKIEEDIIKKEYMGIEIIYLKVPSLKKDLLTFYMKRISIVKKYLNTIIDKYDLIHIHGSEHQYEVMTNDLDIPVVISIQGIISEVVKVIPLRNNIKIYIEWMLSSFYERKYLPQNIYYSCRTHWDESYIKSINPHASIYRVWEMIREDFFHNHYSDKKENVLFVGGKSPIKGLVELLHAYNDSLQNKGLKLIILGQCTSTDINYILRKYHLTNINIANIDCRGVQDVKGMIAAYDESFCFVHPTYIDNSPNSVCEAQLAGLPVIATDVGGVSSLIENGKTGLLIGQKSNEIELAVDTLLNDDILRKNISKNAREIARERHNPISILEQTLNMYNDIKDKE